MIFFWVVILLSMSFNNLMFLKSSLIGNLTFIFDIFAKERFGWASIDFDPFIIIFIILDCK